MFDRLKDLLIEKSPEEPVIQPVKKRMATIVADDPLDVFEQFENETNPSEQPPTDSTDEARELHNDPEGNV